ncbi:MAG: hypothetical protein KAX49_13185 [Halanaerobiales bacterium]|nr:hypothetical protein [Halanaerobiales bacterium]
MSKRLLISLLILIVGIVSLSGCLTKSIVNELNNEAVLLTTLPVEWNFIVYLDGDNNLESYAISDMNEMEQVGSDANINILALVDRHPDYDTTNGDWTGTRLYRITKDVNNSSTIVSELVQDYGELDMSNPQTLKDFIVNCQQLYPSNRTVLTLWNHGDGIYPRNGADLNENKGICWDDTTGSGAWDCLTGNEIATALAEARAITGNNIDIINMDACLMQQLEVAYEWQYEMSYLVGSQEVVPGDGNNYEGCLAALQNNPTQTTLDYAKALVDDYSTNYSRMKTTYSAMSFGVEFDNLVTAFDAFATAMYQTTDLGAVTKARRAATSFTYDEYVDLYDLAGELAIKSKDTNVVSTANTLKTAISSAVVYHKETGTFVGKAFGVSIFLANADEWPVYSDPNQYVSFPLSIDTNWDEFILRYVQYTGGTETTNTSVLGVDMTWEEGNVDLGVMEPNNSYYWISEGTSANGIFSADMNNGGKETWAINSYHALGKYSPMVYSNDYTGNINLKLNFRGETYNIMLNVAPGYGYLIDDLKIKIVQGVRQLTYKVVQKPFRMTNS